MSTFKQWNQMRREEQALSDRLREQGTRRWVLDPTLTAMFGNTSPVEFVFYVSSWPIDDGEMPLIRCSATSGQYSDIDSLSPKVLRRVAAVKQLFHDWASGKLAELPTDCPPEILALP